MRTNWDSVQARHRNRPMRSDITIHENRQRGPVRVSDVGRFPSAFKGAF